LKLGGYGSGKTRDIPFLYIDPLKQGLKQQKEINNKTIELSFYT